MKDASRLILGLMTAVLVLAACGSAPTVTPATPTVLPATPTAAPVIRPVTLTITAGTEVGKDPGYTLATEVPALQGLPDVQAAAFTADVNSTIQSQASDFRKWVQENAQSAAAAGFTEGSYFDERVGLFAQIGNVASLKLVTEAYVAPAAHPYHTSTTYNFDLTDGQALTLDRLFLPGSGYLQAIADYCKSQLAGRDIDFTDFSQGADPTADNYRNWNVTSDDLLITFDEYQVAPYAAGPQTVVVPYSTLQALMDPHGPLSSFVP